MDIRYYLVKNGTDTAAKAPYTIRVVPNGVANLNDLVTEILGRISSSERRVRMVIAEATKVMQKHVLAGETVDFGGIRFKAQIPGSMDYEDSPFTPGVDEVVVCAYVDDELRDTFEGVVPVKISAKEVAASIKVSNVMDVGTENFGEIHGTDPFEILGNGITLDAEGESAKLLDRKTGEVLATAAVTTVSKGQRATCAFAATGDIVPKGQYVLEVTTFGLVGETTPRVFRKPVTLVEAIPGAGPVVTKVVDDYGFESDEDSVYADDSELYVCGTNLRGGDPTARTVKFAYRDTESGDWFDIDDGHVEIVEDTDVRIKVAFDNEPFMEAGKFRVTVTTDRGETTHEGLILK